MKWVLNIMLNRSYGANAPAFFIKNKIPEVDEAMSIYENFISDEQLKSILETQEIKYKLDRNEWYAEGKQEGLAEGLAEGETKKAIEDVCTLITKYKADIDEAMKDLGLDSKYKTQVLEKLKELEG